MRILIANAHRAVAGGVETYLQTLLPALQARGHELALLCEQEPQAGRSVIHANTPGLPGWSTQTLGRTGALAAVKEWQPEAAYVHGLIDPDLESALLDRYPAICFVHSYYGACVSGSKHFSFPRIRTCTRPIGWGCLACYYPRRCGGLNPATMWREFKGQTRRRSLLERYHRILVASGHMRDEFLRQGLSPERVRLAPLFPAKVQIDPLPPAPKPKTGRVLFAGRITKSKGARMLMPVLRLASQYLGEPLSLVVAGEGPEREGLERQAQRFGLAVEFTGWLESTALIKQMRLADVLLLPSLWPEPFGLIGLEAGCLGVPSVAYAVGGIPDWLESGVSGELAPSDPPSVEGLASALARALREPDRLQCLRLGAWKKARTFSLERHIDRIEADFRELAEHAPKGRGVVGTKVRVLLVSHIGKSRATGMGKWTFRIAEELQALGHTPTLWFAEDFPWMGRISRLAALLFPIALAIRIAHRRKDFDAVIIHEPSGFWYGAARKLFRSIPPMMVMCHNVESKCFRVFRKAATSGFAEVSLGMRAKSPLFRLWQSDGAIKLADQVLCLSHEDLTYMEKTLGISSGRITCFSNGVDEAVFPPRRMEHPGQRVLFVGGWLDVKGKCVLPPLWGHIHARWPTARLTIVGSGLNAETVKKSFDFQVRDSVTVIPHIEQEEEMAAQYRRHDHFLLPSLSEGSPLSLLEAMATGMSIVASRRGGIPDLITHERNGLLFDPINPAEGAEMLGRLLTDPSRAAELGRAGQERARQLTWRFAAEAVARTMVEVAT